MNRFLFILNRILLSLCWLILYKADKEELIQLICISHPDSNAINHHNAAASATYSPTTTSPSKEKDEEESQTDQ